MSTLTYTYVFMLQSPYIFGVDMIDMILKKLFISYNEIVTLMIRNIVSFTQ